LEVHGKSVLLRAGVEQRVSKKEEVRVIECKKQWKNDRRERKELYFFGSPHVTPPSHERRRKKITKTIRGHCPAHHSISSANLNSELSIAITLAMPMVK
jgi:hypothetical protein